MDSTNIETTGTANADAGERNFKDINWRSHADICYVNAPTMNEADLPAYVQKCQQEYDEPVTHKEARARAKWLLKESASNFEQVQALKKELPGLTSQGAIDCLQSKIKELEGKISIIRDYATQTADLPAMIRGYKRTTSYSIVYQRTGKVRAQDKGRLRDLCGDILPMPKMEILTEIANRYEKVHGKKLGFEETEKILAIGKSGGESRIFWYDANTETWRGCRHRYMMPSKTGKRRGGASTEVQEKYFKILDEVPPIKFNPDDLTKCRLKPSGELFDLVAYVKRKCSEIGITVLDARGVEKLSRNSWKCIQKNGKTYGPLWKDSRRGETYRAVTGRNYYHPGLFRDMPKMVEGSEEFYEWANARIATVVADEFGADADTLVASAVAAGEVVRIHDPVMADKLIGIDAQAGEQKAKEQAAEAAKPKTNEMDKNILPIVEQLYNRESDLARKFLEMPAFGDPDEKDQWILAQVGGSRTGMDMMRITYHALKANLIRFRKEDSVFYGIIGPDEEEEAA